MSKHFGLSTLSVSYKHILAAGGVRYRRRGRRRGRLGGRRTGPAIGPLRQRCYHTAPTSAEEKTWTVDQRAGVYI